MKIIIQGIIFIGMLFPLPSQSFGDEISSRYATVIYKDEKQLSEFNKRALTNISYRGNTLTLAEEVKSKLDALIEKVITILVRTRPNEQMKIEIRLLPSNTDIEKIYSEKYGKENGFIAFYSPKDDLIFISVDDLSLGILAHELTHAIVTHFFYNAPSRMIHEALAQFVENHIKE